LSRTFSIYRTEVFETFGIQAAWVQAADTQSKTYTEKKDVSRLPSREWIHIPPEGKRKIIFKMPFLMGYVSSLEGIYLSRN